jgi:hypothetical protein
VPNDGRLDHLIGLQIASVELDDVFNNDELRAFSISVPAARIDWGSWALVVAFQTWIYAGDPQAVIRVTDGRIFSVDHGRCFAQLLKGRPAGLIVPELYGVSGIAFPAAHVAAALDRIENLAETEVLAAVAGIPGDSGWRMPIERRHRTAEWLIKRQTRLRETLGAWMPQVS